MLEKLKEKIIKKGTALAGAKGGKQKGKTEITNAEKMVYTWQCRNRNDGEMSKEQCIRDTGLSRGTVYKYWGKKEIHLIDPRYIESLVNLINQNAYFWNDDDYDTETAQFDLFCRGVTQGLAFYRDWIASGDPLDIEEIHDGAQFMRLLFARNPQKMPNIHKDFLRQLLEDFPALSSFAK